jgi:hypothetical protein
VDSQMAEWNQTTRRNRSCSSKKTEVEREKRLAVLEKKVGRLECDQEVQAQVPVPVQGQLLSLGAVSVSVSVRVTVNGDADK